MSTPFDLSKLNPQQRQLIEDALAKTDFDFNQLIPGLQAQVNRSTIPVLFSDLSRYAKMKDSNEAIIAHGFEGHSHDHGIGAHTIEREVEGRTRVLGLAWYSGKVEVERTCPPALAQEVFISESAHMVDFFLMTPAQRQRIFAAYHGGDANAHDHGWFEETGNNNYWDMVGESFMYGFAVAFSKVPTTGDAFKHPTTPEIGKQIRDILAPKAKIARHPGSSIYHRMGGWHERQINDVNQESFADEPAAQKAGLRKCKTCKWSDI